MEGVRAVPLICVRVLAATEGYRGKDREKDRLLCDRASHVSGVISEHGTIVTWKHTGKHSAGLRLRATKAVGFCSGVGEPAEGNGWCVIKLKGCWK